MLSTQANNQKKPQGTVLISDEVFQKAQSIFRGKKIPVLQWN
jgi:hypothetical protein